MAYRPATPFTVPMKLLIPVTSRISGVLKKTFPDPNPKDPKDEPPGFFGSFRTFGGSEAERDGEYIVVDTATVDTWYRPDITADCRIYLVDTGEIYDIIATPEDIDRRHQYLQIRLRKVGGQP